MRSGPEFAACLLVMLSAVAAPTWSASEPLAAKEIAQAIETVRADPNLVTERTRRQLVWDDPEEPKQHSSSHWWQWLADLFGWIGELSQMLMWLVIGALVAVLVVLLLRLFSKPRLPRSTSPSAPTHVRDLDIRPESLPPDLGAAARRLWEAGEHRAALALLYRGLLSRLAHSFAIPIRDSSTEGDCLSLAASVLDARRMDYITRLVRTWQHATYAGRRIDDAVIFELCAGFAAHLPSETDPANPPSTALAGGASA